MPVMNMSGAGLGLRITILRDFGTIALRRRVEEVIMYQVAIDRITKIEMPEIDDLKYASKKPKYLLI
jgi:hypothetical protein